MGFFPWILNLRYEVRVTYWIWPFTFVQSHSRVLKYWFCSLQKKFIPCIFALFAVQGFNSCISKENQASTSENCRELLKPISSLMLRALFSFKNLPLQPLYTCILQNGSVDCCCKKHWLLRIFSCRYSDKRNKLLL